MPNDRPGWPSRSSKRYVLPALLAPTPLLTHESRLATHDASGQWPAWHPAETPGHCLRGALASRRRPRGQAASRWARRRHRGAGGAGGLGRTAASGRRNQRRHAGSRGAAQPAVTNVPGFMALAVLANVMGRVPQRARGPQAGAVCGAGHGPGAVGAGSRTYLLIALGAALYSAEAAFYLQAATQ